MPLLPTVWIACLAALPVNFTLLDCDRQTRALREWHDRPVVVLAFLGAECPVARQYATRLNEIQRDFESRGVAIVGVTVNPSDSADDIAAMRRDLRLSYPILLDGQQTLVNRLAISRQPEVVVLDRERRVRYRGRVDDQFSPGSHKAKPSRDDLQIALNELLAGRPVSLPKTEAAGCPIERKPTVQPSAITYHHDIAPILNRRCVTCHQIGGIAPFSLQTGAEAVRHRRAIQEAVADRRMPPWHADPKHGRFANDPSLTDDERQTLHAWVTGGAPLGPPLDRPTDSKRDGWTMRSPDRIVPLPQAFTLPATGDIPYQLFVVDPGFKEDVWVQEAEIRPGNRKVVHHATVFIRPPGIDALTTQGELQSFCLCAYAMGTPPMLLPDGMAKKIPAGWQLVFVVHYVPNGPGQTDQTKIGLKFLPANVVRKEVATNILLSEDMRIPAGCPDHVETRSRTFEKDVLLLALFPHMHLRGVSFRYDVKYPDGKTEILLSIPRWDMDWQHRYVLAQPKFLPAGSQLTATAHYDNSIANPNNPDASVDVRIGPQTSDEMFNGYYDFCLADQDLTKARWRLPLTWAAAISLLGILLIVRRWRK